MAGATIIFCDLVGFSKKNDSEQIDIIEKLNREISDELYFRRQNQNTPEIVVLPTGDGMLIALMDNDYEPSFWETTLFSLLKRLISWSSYKDNARIRIGVHVGTVSIIKDFNDFDNICGSSINECQRIMDAAHPNQVLISKTALSRYFDQTVWEYIESPFSENKPALFTRPKKIIIKHGDSIEVSIMSEKDNENWVTSEPFSRKTIDNKYERTQLIVKELNSLRNTKRNTDETHEIYEEATFSSFGMLEPAQRAGRTDPAYYNESIKKQKDIFKELANNEKIILWVLIKPMKTIDSLTRLDELINWIELVVSEKNIKLALIPNSDSLPTTNRLIIKGIFSIDGYRIKRGTGYDINIVEYESKKINEHIEEFRRKFDEALSNYPTKQKVLEKLKSLREEYK
jgi:hypothetical protein